MPRIPVRTTPYHTLPRCTRHYKSKRDLILRALGKASFINGSQFVIAWISPKGEVDVYASELLQSVVSPKDGTSTLLNRKELDRETIRVKAEMVKRWDDVRRLEEQGEALVMDDDQDVAEAEGEDEEEQPAEGEEFDGDRTLVEEPELDVKVSIPSSSKNLSPSAMMSTFSAAAPSAVRSSTPQPQLHALTLTSDAIDIYYSTRFAALQQATCKLVVKAWIKVIEPKKQMKFPYNRGQELKPIWWPEGVRHREPDHLSKLERLTLLVSIVRSPLITVSRLELSTAEAAAFISRPRQTILREVYLVAKEEEKRRQNGDIDTDLVVHLPHTPVSPSTVSPEQNEKRPHSAMATAEALALEIDIKENVFYQPTSADQIAYPVAKYPMHGSASGSKRAKYSHPSQGDANGRLTPLTTSTHYDNVQTNPVHAHAYTQPFTFALQHIQIPSQSAVNAWRDGLSVHSPASHLSPYPPEQWMGNAVASARSVSASAPPLTASTSIAGSEYAHSSMPLSAIEADASRQLQATTSAATGAPTGPARFHAHHLAPILTHHAYAHSQGTPSPMDSPAFPQTASMHTSYFSTHTHTRHHTHPPHGQSAVGHGYLQQQQHHASQQGYDYGSPYIADNWDGQYATGYEVHEVQVEK